MPAEFVRGAVFLADLGGGRRPWVIVSNNHRNRYLDNVAAVKVTTTQKYENLPTVVTVPEGECIRGYVRCDSITMVYKDEFDRHLGGLGRQAMLEISAGLKAALSLS